MRTLVRKTSIEAYHQLDRDTQQAKILDMIAYLSDACIADLAASLGWERSTVSARMNELKKAGRIVFTEKKPSIKTGINSEHWRVKENKTELLFAEE